MSSADVRYLLRLSCPLPRFAPKKGGNNNRDGSICLSIRALTTRTDSETRTLSESASQHQPAQLLFQENK